MKKIFVGNLSWKVTEEVLKPVFEAFGEVVSVKIIADQYTGKSKGFGFVEMADAESAKASIDKLNETMLLERPMRVSLAQERTERREFRGNTAGMGSGFGGGFGGGNGGGGFGGGNGGGGFGGGNRSSRPPRGGDRY